MINDNILSLIEKTPDSLLTGLAARVKARRLERNWTQRMLAARAGMTLGSYRRFEASGEISLRSLVMLAFALDATDGFETLFGGSGYRSIEDMLDRQQAATRKRGTKNE